MKFIKNTVCSVLTGIFVYNMPASAFESNQYLPASEATIKELLRTEALKNAERSYNDTLNTGTLIQNQNISSYNAVQQFIQTLPKPVFYGACFGGCVAAGLGIKWMYNNYINKTHAPLHAAMNDQARGLAAVTQEIDQQAEQTNGLVLRQQITLQNINAKLKQAEIDGKKFNKELRAQDEVFEVHQGQVQTINTLEANNAAALNALLKVQEQGKNKLGAALGVAITLEQHLQNQLIYNTKNLDQLQAGIDKEKEHLTQASENLKNAGKNFKSADDTLKKGFSDIKSLFRQPSRQPTQLYIPLHPLLLQAKHQAIKAH